MEKKILKLSILWGEKRNVSNVSQTKKKKKQAKVNKIMNTHLQKRKIHFISFFVKKKKKKDRDNINYMTIREG